MRYIIYESVAMFCLLASLYLMYKGENTGGFYMILTSIFATLTGIGDLLYDRFKDDY